MNDPQREERLRERVTARRATGGPVQSCSSRRFRYGRRGFGDTLSGICRQLSLSAPGVAVPVLRFFNSPAGRVSRVVLGVVLIAVGVSLGGWWWLLALLGLLPLAAGLFNFCTLAPLFGMPLSGRRFREASRNRARR
ncbi:YgaP-like transmembrane domain [Micromonospora aurantiaca (nom. illeg.)]|uniref:YgaP-like transmembrane domain n=1 Tax=Micromonospora aurantiaca (nom. illeg.) TaxID=47850 RepID=UPI0037873AAA